MKTPTLKVQRLYKGAKPPECAHPGQDLGYDIFSWGSVILLPNVPTKVTTGIAVELEGYGFIMKDRSSMASKGIIVTGGVIDAGYRGELNVVLTNISEYAHNISEGDKIAQLIPIAPRTRFPVKTVAELSPSVRGTGGFGSTGK